MGCPQLPLSDEAIAQFCGKWRIREFSVFGSILREDFNAASDVDVLVSFLPDSRVGLWQLAEMVEELEALCGREVDLVELESLTNPFRRKRILETREILYAA